MATTMTTEKVIMSTKEEFEAFNVISDLLEEAARNGNLKMITSLMMANKWSDEFDMTRLVEIACEHGHVHIVERLFDDVKDHKNALYYASFGGHLNVVKFLVQDKQVTITENDFEAVIEGGTIKGGGHLDVFNYIIEKSNNFIENRDVLNRLLCHAAECGHEEMVKILIDRGANNIRAAKSVSSGDAEFYLRGIYNKEIHD